MCRLFGFRASAPSAVHRALVLETNALRSQSLAHPDGWGLAFYEDGRPQVARGVDGAFRDDDFERVSRFVSSETVVAHVRKASVGPLRLENTHPFEHGPWVFAHNGTVPQFAEHVREPVEALIAPAHRALISGDTDSERVFRLFLTELGEGPATLSAMVEALGRTIRHVIRITRAAGAEPSLNVVVTDGQRLAAFRHGRTLHFSTHKTRCPERDTCRAFAPRCEAPSRSGERVSHLIVASERIGAVDEWQELAEDEFVGVDEALTLWRSAL